MVLVEVEIHNARQNIRIALFHESINNFFYFFLHNSSTWVIYICFILCFLNLAFIVES